MFHFQALSNLSFEIIHLVIEWNWSISLVQHSTSSNLFVGQKQSDEQSAQLMFSTFSYLLWSISIPQQISSFLLLTQEFSLLELRNLILLSGIESLQKVYQHVTCSLIVIDHSYSNDLTIHNSTHVRVFFKRLTNFNFTLSLPFFLFLSFVRRVSWMQMQLTLVDNRLLLIFSAER